MFDSLLVGVVQYVYTFVSFALLCTIAEVLVEGERQTWTSRVRGFLFSVISAIAGIGYAAFAFAGLQGLGLKPLFLFDLAWMQQSSNIVTLVLGYTLIPFMGALLFDLCFYFFHRLQHRVPMLWRLHSVHHSIEELNAFNNFHHATEKILQTTLIHIPVMILVGFNLPQTALTIAILMVQEHLLHANTRLSWGAFRLLLAEPRYHRIHHSVEKHHWNKNFAAAFPIWDMLFKTAYFPTPSEFPRTGLNYMGEPKNIREFLFPQAPSADVGIVPQHEEAQRAGS